MSTLRLGGHYLAMVTISFQQIVTLVMINCDPAHARAGRRAEHRAARRCSVLAGLSRLRRRRPRDHRLFRLASAGDAARPRDARGARQRARGRASPASTSTAPRSRPSRSAPLLGGLGGGLFAGGFTYVSPDQFSFAESIVFLTMALLGGVASPIGSAIGTGLLILIPEWLRFLKSVPGPLSRDLRRRGHPDHPVHAGRHLGLRRAISCAASSRRRRRRRLPPLVLAPDRDRRRHRCSTSTACRNISAA